MDTGQIGYLYVDPADLGERLLFYARTLQRDYTWLGILLGLAGLAWQLRHRAADAVFLLVIFGLQAFLAANHHLPRQWTFFIPSFMIYTLWIGESLGALWSGLEQLRARWGKLGTLLAFVLALIMILVPLISFPERYQAFRDIHHGQGTLDVWRQALKLGRMGDRMGSAITLVDQDAVIVADWEQATPLWYYQQVEGLRPDVDIVYPVERLDEAAASGRPLYLSRNQPGLAERWHPFSTGPLIALNPEAVREPPAGSVPLRIKLGDTFELAGFTYGQSDFYPATVVPLTLFWRALQDPPHDYSVSLRLMDGEREVVVQVDSQHPVLGTFPTSQWIAGEVVGDYYELQLPGDLPPGLYHWSVILYRSLPEGGWESLRVEGTDSDLAMGGEFEVRER
jgi:hypothetical protein